MRKALVVGINDYQKSPLYGCVRDAYSVKEKLERHSDGTVNFSVKLLTAEQGQGKPVQKAELKDQIKELFNGDSECALFYFAGHGDIEVTGGYILASDTTRGDDGIPLSEILTLANQSKARNKIIVLDSCNSGIAGNSPLNPATSELAEGVTILTASTAEQYATEVDGSGVFTMLFVDALGGAAGNLTGDVTPGSIYAHIDQSLGPWEQRPVFKTNVKNFVSLRKVQSPIALQDLRRITHFFPEPGFELRLDPSFEPERGGQEPPTCPPPDPSKAADFQILQRYNRVNLVVPVEASHMWHAAMQSKSCKLTVLGEHYRRLVEKSRI